MGRARRWLLSSRARFRERLEGATRVHVGARVLAFHLLAAEGYLALTRLLFAGLEAGSIRGQTSAVTLYQLLVEPHRRAGSEGEDVPDRAFRLLTTVPGLEIVPVTPRIASQAARVRASLGGRTERALQIATALAAGADLFLTEGTGLRRIAGMEVVNLEDYPGA